jgi:prefoldin subunit 5
MADRSLTARAARLEAIIQKASENVAKWSSRAEEAQAKLIKLREEAERVANGQ